MNQDAANLIRSLERQIIEGELNPGTALLRMAEWAYADALNQCDKASKMEAHLAFVCGCGNAAHYIQERAK